MAVVVPSYKGFRYPVEIISHCVWLYHRFPLRALSTWWLMRVSGGSLGSGWGGCGAVVRRLPGPVR
jgi:hypothetical protein